MKVESQTKLDVVDIEEVDFNENLDGSPPQTTEGKAEQGKAGGIHTFFVSFLGETFGSLLVHESIFCQ